MIEAIILNYLKKKGIKAYMEENDNMPEEYVLIEKTGSGEENYLKRATLALQSFSSSLYKTAELNETLKEVMKQSIELDDVCKCSLNSDYVYNDKLRKKYRYQAVFDIVHY